MSYVDSQVWWAAAVVNSRRWRAAVSQARGKSSVWSSVVRPKASRWRAWVVAVRVASTDEGLPEQLLHLLFDAQLGPELAQLRQVLEQHRVRDEDGLGPQSRGVPVERDHAKSAFGVRVAQEPDLTRARGDHEVAQRGDPGRVGPDLGEQRGRHR
jgi:hypothetical protein